MLKITRRAGERIIVGDEIIVTLLEISGQTARIGIDAPRAIPVYREEIWVAVKSENEAAASAAEAALLGGEGDVVALPEGDDSLAAPSAVTLTTDN
jgi:carbon storage regulator